MNNILDLEKRESRNQRRRELYAQKKRRNEACSDMLLRRSRRFVATSEQGSSSMLTNSNKEIEIQRKNEALSKHPKRTQVSLKEYYCYKLQIRDSGLFFIDGPGGTAKCKIYTTIKFFSQVALQHRYLSDKWKAGFKASTA